MSTQTWLKPLPGFEKDYIVHIESLTKDNISFIFTLCGYPKGKKNNASLLSQAPVHCRIKLKHMDPTFYYTHLALQSSFDRSLRAFSTMKTITKLLEKYKSTPSIEDVVINVMLCLEYWKMENDTKLSDKVIETLISFMNAFCVKTAKPGIIIQEEYTGFVRLQAILFRKQVLPPSVLSVVKESLAMFWEMYGELKYDIATCLSFRENETIYFYPHIVSYSDLTEGYTVPVHLKDGRYIEGEIF